MHRMPEESGGRKEEKERVGKDWGWEEGDEGKVQRTKKKDVDGCRGGIFLIYGYVVKLDLAPVIKSLYSST
jgi:hypothetical protein